MHKIFKCYLAIFIIILATIPIGCKKEKVSTSSDTVTDIDGNIYDTVIIGTQVWMKENLKTTKYANGDIIGTTIPATLDISYADTCKYQWAYDGNESNVEKYGRLYTWYAATDNRKACPTGWHVPSDVEWTTLTDYLTDNGYGYQGSGDDIAKSMAFTSGWMIDTIPGNVGNDQASNNSSGFSALPAGLRSPHGAPVFQDKGWYTLWWSSTAEAVSEFAYCRFMSYPTCKVFRPDPTLRNMGGSIRCLRDK
jgi:uncharacterized protein (TIGR02145 family)